MKISTTIYDAVDAVRVRPEMFVGHKGLVALNAYLMGYCDGILRADAELETESPSFHDFSRWVAQKLGRGVTVEGWCRSICAVAKDDAEAVVMFFALLDEYRTSSHQASS